MFWEWKLTKSLKNRFPIGNWNDNYWKLDSLQGKCFWTHFLAIYLNWKESNEINVEFYTDEIKIISYLLNFKRGISILWDKWEKLRWGNEKLIISAQLIVVDAFFLRWQTNSPRGIEFSTVLNNFPTGELFYH